MKKLLALLLSVVMLLSLVACGDDGDNDDDEDSHTHRYSESVVEPSCTEEGYTLQTCKCGKTRKRDKVPATGHDFVNNVCTVCGATDGEISVPDQGYDGSQVTITFYHSMGRNKQDILDDYIWEFNKLYPNITIDHLSLGDYDTIRDQIKTEIAVGYQPNLAFCYGDHVAVYNIANAVLPLDELMDSTAECIRADGTVEILGLTDYQKSDLIPGFLEEGRQFGDGLTYMMPFSKSTEVLYYNKDFFDQHGLAVPTTWDELWEVYARIKAIDPDCYPLGYDSEDNWFINYCLQSGAPYTSATGDHYLFNNSLTKQFIRDLRDYYDYGYFTTLELWGTYTSGIFTEENCYMCIASSGGATYQQGDFEVGIANVPQVNPYDPKAISQGPNLCIFNSDNQQEVYASWLFVKFLCTNPEFQAEYSMSSGYMPAIGSVTENPGYQSFLNNDNIVSKVLNHCLNNADVYTPTPIFESSGHVRDVVGTLLVAGVATDCDLDELFANAITACEYGDNLSIPSTPANPPATPAVTKYYLYNAASDSYVTTYEGYYTNNGKDCIIMSNNVSEACAFEIIDDGYSVCLRTDWGEYLCCDGNNVTFDGSDYSVPNDAMYYMDEYGDGYVLRCAYAVYGEYDQYLDVYSGGLACYRWQNDSTEQYIFQLIEAN